MVVSVLMNLLRAASRVVLGVVFILSGILKIIDPIGSGLKIKEYLIAFHLGFLDFLSTPAAILFASLEFVLGVAILKGLRMRLASRVILYFMAFFTLLTFYSALFSPVEDCGCFGEAIHLTNWETFFKNVILILAALFIYLQRDNFKEISTPKREWIYIIGYSFVALFISIFSLIKLPQIDFGGFKPGTDLVEYQVGVEQEYSTILIYSKDGKNREFSLDNLPDSTWSFVDSKTELVEKKNSFKSGVDFAIKDSLGGYIGEEFFYNKGAIFIASFYNVSKASQRTIAKLNKLYDSLANRGKKLIIISGGFNDRTKEVFKSASSIPLYYTDFKTLIALNRSNGGLTYTYNGVVIEKWSRFNYPTNKLNIIFSQDAELLMANQIIREKLFLQILLATLFIAILAIRYNLRNIKKSAPETEEQSSSSN